MKIQAPMITNSDIQIKAFNEGNLRIKLQLARTTEDKKVQEIILKEDNPRVLIALASNLNLDRAVEEELAGSKLPGVVSALLSRRA
jgi:hypothetical protein